MNPIIPLLFGGLALFLYAISKLSSVMKGLFSEKAEGAIRKYTSNLFLALLIGIVTTIMLNSSSAVIIITIVLINIGTLNFHNAAGLILGANIGTTVSSQFFALNIGSFAVIPLVLGLLASLYFKQDKLVRTGKVMFYFGLLFFGLFLMEEAVHPLQQSELFHEWIEKVNHHPERGALIGGAVTLILQSSSATVGIAIVLGKQQLISVAGGIAIMMGAELGTCSDTLLATINGSRQAIKAGIFHLLFNLTTIMLGLIFFYPFLELVQEISGNVDIENQIANAHMIFNVCGVILFLPITRYFVKLLDWILPDKKPSA